MIFCIKSKEEWRRFLVHIPIGLIGGFLYLAHWVFVPTFMGLFVAYGK